MPIIPRSVIRFTIFPRRRRGQPLADMTEAAFFYLFSGTILTAALLVIFSRQPIYSVLSLLVAMFCLAALFVMLGAYFVAALQILLYAGAVLVLFLFVVMLLNLGQDALARVSPFTQRGLGIVVAIALGAQFVWLFSQPALSIALASTPTQKGTVDQIGQLLFTKYLLPFEVTSFLILAAIVGAITLARGMWKRE